MKQNVIIKIFVIGAIILFSGTIIQPVISKDILQDEEIVIPEKDCNCAEIDNSGRPICDLLLQIIDSYELKIEKANELYEKYKNDPLRSPIISFYMITLLNRWSHVGTLLFVFGCNINP